MGILFLVISACFAPDPNAPPPHPEQPSQSTIGRGGSGGGSSQEP